MEKRSFDEMIAYFNRRVSEMEIDQDYKMELLGMVTAIGYKHEQTAQQWIPCKTKLPKKGKYVLCQCRAGIMDVLRLTDDNGWYKDSTHIYMHGFVLAWMPTPEPYQEEGD